MNEEVILRKANPEDIAILNKSLTTDQQLDLKNIFFNPDLVRKIEIAAISLSFEFEIEGGKIAGIIILDYHCENFIGDIWNELTNLSGNKMNSMNTILIDFVYFYNPNNQRKSNQVTVIEKLEEEKIKFQNKENDENPVINKGPEEVKEKKEQKTLY